MTRSVGHGSDEGDEGSPGSRRADDLAGLPVIAVVGPTATGKSDLAVALARHLGGEVVNADAMALYRGMDIGTAKPTPAERAGVPHHQLDVLEVTQQASVAAYQQAARADLDAIAARGRVAILVGGSGLYVRAALDLLEIPPTDPAVRARLQARADEPGGLDELRGRLHRLDEMSAARIEPNNARRIVRALEVIELTGRPYSASLPERVYRHPTLAIGLTLPRSALDTRIDARVTWMWRAGLLEEVRRLMDEGLAHGRTARTALGYAQAIAQLAGELTQAQAVAATAQATRRFARRQQSWFGPDPRIRWLPADAPDLLGQALALVGAGSADPGHALDGRQ